MLICLHKKYNRFSNGAGFTLIELIVILVLIVSLASFGGVRMMNTYRQHSLDQMVSDIQTMIRYLQVKAIAQGVIYQLSISEDQKSFVLKRLKAGERQFEEVRLALVRRIRAGKLFTLQLQRNGQLLFYPDGSTSKNKLKILRGMESRSTIELTNRIGSIKVTHA